MNSRDLINKFHATLPAVREWIETILEEYKEQAVPVTNLPFPLLKTIYPIDLLNRAKAVVVDEKVPFPPLGQMGLPELLLRMENIPMAGITYKDTFFVNRLHQTESIYFHELVHVVQWERLGVDNFLLAYGVGLMQFDYRNSPFEQMAYSLQAAFDQGALPVNVIEQIRQGTDAIWGRVTSVISMV